MFDYTSRGAPTIPSPGSGPATCYDIANSALYVSNSLGGWITADTSIPTAITASGAITVRPRQTYVITKAGVAAMTLAAPTATADDGVILRIYSSTANAHTITATGLLQTGSASVNVATFAASAGAGVTLMAYQAKWIVLSAVGITFS